MKSFKGAVALAAMGLALAGRAQATTLFTAPASPSFANEAMFCNVINVRSTPIKVTMEARGYDGTLTNGPSTTTVNPGTFDSMQSTGAFCKFTVSGPKSSVRASAEYFKAADFNPAINVPAK